MDSRTVLSRPAPAVHPQERRITTAVGEHEPNVVGVALQLVAEDSNGRFTLLAQRLPHGRERRGCVASILDIVESDDRNAAGDNQPPGVECAQHAERGRVVRGDDGIERITELALIQEDRCRQLSALEVELAGGDQLGIERNAMLVEGLAVGLESFLRLFVFLGTADERDALASVSADQVPDGGLEALAVVDLDAGHPRER